MGRKRPACVSGDSFFLSKPARTRGRPNTEEQINELSELLAHVLDKISSLKSAIHEKNRGDDRKNKAKKKTREEEVDSDASKDEEEAQSEKKAATPPQRKSDIDFSGCF